MSRPNLPQLRTPKGSANPKAAETIPYEDSLDYALEMRHEATSLALGVMGLVRELETYEIEPKEINRRVYALAMLAAEVLEGTEKLDVAMERASK